jgi:hypothetical protein
MPNMLSLAEGTIAVAVHNGQPPTRAEWDEWMRVVMPIPVDELRILVFTDGGAPDAAQRAQFVERVKTGRPRIAVTSSSATVRAAATALSWFVKGIQVFPPGSAGLQSGIDFLGIDRALADPLITRAYRESTKLEGGRPRCLVREMVTA